MMPMRVLIAGLSGSSHIGGSFMRAAGKLGLGTHFCDMNEAWRPGTLLQKLLWHFGDRRPVRMGGFGLKVLHACAQFRPDLLLATGMAPLERSILERCRQMGVRCVNYSTDDPFAKAQHARWFLSALRCYDLVFSPRRANLDELKAHGCLRVEYLPFGYDPDLFYPPPLTEATETASDLFFAGTADSGRVPFITAAVRAGLNVRLHGINWNNYPETRELSRGQADIPTLRRAIQNCRVALCVVRHENRDGHSMRTFELPAVGACMVVEDTPEHREIFGPDGKTVRYFQTPAEMVARTSWLLEQSSERERLKAQVHEYITRGKNTYGDRLMTIIRHALRFPPAAMEADESARAIYRPAEIPK
jgi:spore maturation protein CgeB